VGILAGPMLQRVKDVLVKRGPGSRVVRLALMLHARRRGFTVRFRDGRISINQHPREIVLAERDFYMVPFMLDGFDPTLMAVSCSRWGRKRFRLLDRPFESTRSPPSGSVMRPPYMRCPGHVIERGREASD
jgi:hypothetical protein